jgi:hypothetical protein
MRSHGLIAAILLTACSSSTASDAVLTGTYVGDRIGLLAATTSSELSLPCRIITLGPIVPGIEGTLQAAGTVTSSIAAHRGRSARITGISSGPDLTLTVEWYREGNWEVVASGSLQSSPGADHRVDGSCTS